VNIKGDWALAEWYPNYVKKVQKKGIVAETPAEEEYLAPAELLGVHFVRNRVYLLPCIYDA